MDLRKPGEDEEEDYEMADDSMEPEECFPDCKKIKRRYPSTVIYTMVQNG